MTTGAYLTLQKFPQNQQNEVFNLCADWSLFNTIQKLNRINRTKCSIYVLTGAHLTAGIRHSIEGVLRYMSNDLLIYEQLFAPTPLPIFSTPVTNLHIKNPSLNLLLQYKKIN